MMKKIVFSAAIAASLALVSCGETNVKSETVTNAADSTKTVDSVFTVNEAEWELRDLTGLDSLKQISGFSVKLPKGAIIEKDFLDLKVLFPNAHEYVLEIRGQEALRPLKEYVTNQRLLEVDSARSATNDTKLIAEDANGYIYSSQVKAEDGSLIDKKPIVHFTYFILKGDQLIRIEDAHAGVYDDKMANEENTKKIYSIISSSAAFK
ncbi:MAG: hypothetical protein J0G98_11130 [Terrimonas ferruginea]|mgnify:CR=1 FL=1|uniref:hypothetical protein n=1 Tax=Terrimonas ferruginea TaxID=249 RepID=UPI0009262B03|nr:hypothetical protein [Terrimonas ferruginea]MBN8783609.1 hypothetical protein [Terrimonas ferruginea]OJW40353.1 MAG: hypothetical protein BGO56_09940 [Sphingobacteriales bacterium 48-107]